MRTIVTWVWHGQNLNGTDYTPEHAAALGAMLRRHMTAPYRLIVFSDDDGDVGPHAEKRPIPEAARAVGHLKTPEAKRFPTCYRRLWLFSEEARELGDQVMLTDVDVVVTGDWSPLFDRPEPFVGWKPGMSWGNTERRVAGGQWLLRTGTCRGVWDDFVRNPALAIKTARDAGFRGSDQAWISYKLAHAAPVWPDGSGVYSVRDFTRDDRRKVVSQIPRDARVVHFNGINNPWDRAAWNQHPWLAKFWPTDVVAPRRAA